MYVYKSVAETKGLQMRHWQAVHLFDTMEFQINAEKEGVMNHAGLQSKLIPDEQFDFSIRTDADPVHSLQLSKILLGEQVCLQHETPDDCFCL
ncbi:MAG: hypothetical protein ACLUE5_02640 [Dysosmobacter sp.]|jgi:hypothetical protein